MGEDFNYQAAHTWFKNMDKLILYANKQQLNGSKYNLIYSTPSCYLKAVKEATKGKVDWTVKYDDFFPYASDPHAYWTGYFTSRPTLKRFERLGNNLLQVCKQLYSLTDLGPEDWTDLNVLREAMGIMQHHDAITGTEKQQVAFDYARILSKGFDECEFISKTALSKLINGKTPLRTNPDPSPEINLQSCLLTNISQCPITEQNDRFVVTIYNPLSRNVTHFVRLPVTETAYDVFDYAGNSIPTQLMPIPDSILSVPGRVSPSTIELVFIAEDIPPLGFSSFYVSKIPGDNVMKPHRYHSISLKSQVGIDPETGKVDKIKINDQLVMMYQDFMYYHGAVGNNTQDVYRSSGAYIFRPNDSMPIEISEVAEYEIYQGKIVAELRQVFNDWTSQIVRVYKDEPLVEFDWLIGPIPANGTNGKEVITKYSTNMITNSTFYTDTNGRETMTRIRDYRPTWDVKLSEDVSGNYYPVTSKISLRDYANNVELAVLTDRAQGGTSLVDGEIELMLHRNCLHDDAFGVAEELDEQAFGKRLVARGSHYLIAGPIVGNEKRKSIAAQERDIAQRKLLAAWTFVSETLTPNFNNYKKKYKMRYSGLTHSLPDNVQILTLEPWKATTFLLRLEHVFERKEDPILSRPVIVDLKNLFASFEIVWYNETTLGGNQWLGDNKKMKFEDYKALLKKNRQEDAGLEWKAQPSRMRNNQIDSNDIYTVFSNHDHSHADKLNFSIRMMPMQIRTFIIEVERKKKW